MMPPGPMSFHMAQGHMNMNVIDAGPVHAGFLSNIRRTAAAEQQNQDFRSRISSSQQQQNQQQQYNVADKRKKQSNADAERIFEWGQEDEEQRKERALDVSRVKVT